MDTVYIGMLNSDLDVHRRLWRSAAADLDRLLREYGIYAGISARRVICTRRKEHRTASAVRSLCAAQLSDADGCRGSDVYRISETAFSAGALRRDFE